MVTLFALSREGLSDNQEEEHYVIDIILKKIYELEAVEVLEAVLKSAQTEVLNVRTFDSGKAAAQLKASSST